MDSKTETVCHTYGLGPLLARKAIEGKGQAQAVRAKHPGPSQGMEGQTSPGCTCVKIGVCKYIGESHFLGILASSGCCERAPWPLSSPGGGVYKTGRKHGWASLGPPLAVSSRRLPCEVSSHLFFYVERP